MLEELVGDGMSAGIVDQLELVEVDVEKRMLPAFLVCQMQHAAQAALELRTIDEPGQTVVGRPMVHLPRHASLLGHIADDDHLTENTACAVAQGGSRRLNTVFRSIAREQDRLQRQAVQRGVFPRRIQARVDGNASLLVDGAKHLAQWSAPGLRDRPAGHALGDRVQPGHFAIGGPGPPLTRA